MYGVVEQQQQLCKQKQVLMAAPSHLVILALLVLLVLLALLVLLLLVVSLPSSVQPQPQ